MEYKIKVKEQGYYFIEVLRKKSDNVFHLEWLIDLKSEAEVPCSLLYPDNHHVRAMDLFLMEYHGRG